MPFYDYSCPKCLSVTENVMHTISEVDNPTAETISEITCHCTKKGTRMLLAFNTAPGIKTPTRNRVLTQSRKKRNKDHFNREILPTIKDKDLKKHHISKLGKT